MRLNLVKDLDINGVSDSSDWNNYFCVWKSFRINDIIYV